MLLSNHLRRTKLCWPNVQELEALPQMTLQVKLQLQLRFWWESYKRLCDSQRHPVLVKARSYCFGCTILELLTIQQIINPIGTGRRQRAVWRSFESCDFPNLKILGKNKQTTWLYFLSLDPTVASCLLDLVKGDKRDLWWGSGSMA